MDAKTGPSVTLSAIVVRACGCGHKREIGKPCEGCGNKKPAKVTDLGIIASNQRSRWKRIKWALWEYHFAQRRIRRTNRAMLKER